MGKIFRWFQFTMAVIVYTILWLIEGRRDCCTDKKIPWRTVYQQAREDIH